MRRPSIIVHSADHARAAAAAASALAQPVRLVSPPLGAASYGPEVFREMVALAQDAYPDADLLAVLDCGAAPGLALAAFRRGIRAVRVTLDPAVRAKVADIAAQSGAVIDAATGDALDLRDIADPVQACRDWLLGHREA